MDNEKQHLEKCRQKIEEKVGWGPGTEWQNHDFEVLSDRILKETKVSLSVSTLKRLWGKIRYEGTPNIATLNTLAQFVGYENWRAFTANGFNHPINGTPAKENGAAMKENSVAPKAHKQFVLSNVQKGMLAVVVLGLAAFLFWSTQKRSKSLTYKNISFSSMAVTNSVPNTVVFYYNAKDSNADSVFIQQSWDPARRFRVDKNLTEFTSTYYEPGYYRAKLILDNTVVAEHDIFIETNPWLATIERGPIPVYAGADKILQAGIVRLPEEFLTAEKIDLEKENLWTSFYRVLKTEVVPDTAFQMDAAVKNTFGKGALVCQQTELILKGTEGAIVIPLSIKGCTGEISLQAGDHYDGRTHDLANFGVDFSDWVNVQCRVQHKKVAIRVNDVLAFEGDYKNRVGQIVGARIRFMGTGEIKQFELKKI